MISNSDWGVTLTIAPSAVQWATPTLPWLLGITLATAYSWYAAYREWRPTASRRANLVIRVLDSQGRGVASALFGTSASLAVMTHYLDADLGVPGMDALRLPIFLNMLAFGVVFMSIIFFRQPWFLMPPRYRGWWMWHSIPEEHTRMEELPFPAHPRDPDLRAWFTAFEEFQAYVAQYSEAVYVAGERPDNYTGPSWQELQDRLSAFHAPSEVDQRILSEMRGYAAQFDGLYRVLQTARLPRDMRRRPRPT